MALYEEEETKTLEVNPWSPLRPGCSHLSGEPGNRSDKMEFLASCAGSIPARNCLKAKILFICQLTGRQKFSMIILFFIFLEKSRLLRSVQSFYIMHLNLC